MRTLWARVRTSSAPALFVIAAIFSLGAILWLLGPDEGDKYSDLGINLAVGAALGVAVLYVEALVGRAEAERERRLSEEQRFLQTLLAATDVAEIRVSGRNLAGSILPGRDLRGADMTSTDLTRADLRRTNLAHADVSESRAEGANLFGATVDALRAIDVRWRGAHLATIAGTAADFSQADLNGATLTDARLPRVVLDRADLEGADLRRADLSACRGAETVLRGADLRASSLRGATLIDPDLRDADLRAADLRDATIVNADLRGTDMRDCNTTGLSLRSPLTDERTILPSTLS